LRPKPPPRPPIQYVNPGPYVWKFLYTYSIPGTSSGARAKWCVFVSRSTTALRFSAKSDSFVSAVASAAKMSLADEAALRPSGRFLAKRRDAKSTRSSESSNSALYIRCRSRLPRRTSTMKAIAGLRAAM
jgi:hypothetical protein